VATPEWDEDQRLAFEKEVLGFYVSGHPLARFAPVVESMGVTRSSELPARSAGARVLLLGQVSQLKETSTKSGNRMAFFTLEDMDGTVEVTVFPEAFKAGVTALRAREPVLVRGRIDDGDKGRVVLAEDVRALESALAAPAPRPAGEGGGLNACRLRVAAGDDAMAALASVRRIVAEHPGPVPIFLHIILPDQVVIVRARGGGVDPGPEVVAKLEELLGAGAISVEHAGRA
jgi:DNA polymerase-3 subunit alpha